MTSPSDLANVHIESSLPKSWEEQKTFNDVLYEWMNRAPWFGISAALHALVLLILAAIPWEQFQETKTNTITAQLDQIEEVVTEEPPPPEEELEEEPIEEPVLQDAETLETDDQQEFEEAQGEPDFSSDANFESDSFNDVIGIGAGAGGKFGGRFGGNKKGGGRGGKAIELALAAGLDWLKQHQSNDGRWDCDGFSENCGKLGTTVCSDPGRAQHDVGVTGLALLAFLGEGSTMEMGSYKEQVQRGVSWLRQQQNPDSGLFGDASTHEFLYNHAIATVAMCEAYYFSKSPQLKAVCQNAINYIQRARNPYSAWRYEVPPNGDSDTSVTGWMVFALASAKDGGLKVDAGAFEGAMSFIDEVTDPTTGRIGYSKPGEASSRILGTNDQFPANKGEAMTAVGLLCRIFTGQNDVQKFPVLGKHADLLRLKPPVWEPGVANDAYYWYYGTYAMYQMGGAHWTNWEKEMKKAIVETQRDSGDEKGSWDAVSDAWGFAGGRVYTTALCVLSLEVYFRYARVLGAR
jgi:hypothetical protein